MSSLLCVNLRAADEVASNIPVAAIYMPFTLIRILDGGKHGLHLLRWELSVNDL